MPLSVVININFGLISHRFQDVAIGQFSAEKSTFLPSLFNPKFENVPFALYFPNFVGREPRQRANYSCKSFFS